MPLLEIACFNISSAIAAANAGANRIELCDNPQEGGTTPSFGTIRLALEKISIPVFPIIRPRGGDFLYNEDEFATMLYDVQQCKALGCQGVVLGILKPNGYIDIERTNLLVETAGGMEVTFHRAFDRAANPLQAMEDIIATGCKRLLTSGQKETAWDGKDLIQQLVKQADERLIVMPGSGVRSHNVLELASFTGAVEMHSSARKKRPSEMEYVSAGIAEVLSTTTIDTDEVMQMKTKLKSGFSSFD